MDSASRLHRHRHRRLTAVARPTTPTRSTACQVLVARRLHRGCASLPGNGAGGSSSALGMSHQHEVRLLRMGVDRGHPRPLWRPARRA